MMQMEVQNNHVYTVAPSAATLMLCFILLSQASVPRLAATLDPLKCAMDFYFRDL